MRLVALDRAVQSQPAFKGCRPRVRLIDARLGREHCGSRSLARLPNSNRWLLASSLVANRNVSLYLQNMLSRFNTTYSWRIINLQFSEDAHLAFIKE